MLPIFLYLIFLIFKCQAVIHSVSNKSSSNLEFSYEDDCPICYTPLLEEYPRFFSCDHHNFHSNCILGNNNTTPLVTRCPLCRAPKVNRLFTNDIEIAKELINMRFYSTFNALIRGRVLEDKTVLEFVSLFLFRDKNGYISMAQLKIVDWRIMLPSFTLCLDRYDNDAAHIIINMSGLSSAHKM